LPARTLPARTLPARTLPARTLPAVPVPPRRAGADGRARTRPRTDSRAFTYLHLEIDSTIIDMVHAAEAHSQLAERVDLGRYLWNVDARRAHRAH